MKEKIPRLIVLEEGQVIRNVTHVYVDAEQKYAWFFGKDFAGVKKYFGKSIEISKPIKRMAISDNSISIKPETTLACKIIETGDIRCGGIVELYGD